jgi:hypothetical protein
MMLCTSEIYIGIDDIFDINIGFTISDSIGIEIIDIQDHKIEDIVDTKIAHIGKKLLWVMGKIKLFELFLFCIYFPVFFVRFYPSRHFAYY